MSDSFHGSGGVPQENDDQKEESTAGHDALSSEEFFKFLQMQKLVEQMSLQQKFQEEQMSLQQKYESLNRMCNNNWEQLRVGNLSYLDQRTLPNKPPGNSMTPISKETLHPSMGHT